jgi:hypothetical protein
MKKVAVLAIVLIALVGVAVALLQQHRGVVGPRPTTLEPPRDECGPRQHVVQIRLADPADKTILPSGSTHHDHMRDTFIEMAQTSDTTILLGPNVVLDFSELQARDPAAVPGSKEALLALPILIGRCVTIRSVAWFGRSPSDVSVEPDGTVIARVAPSPAPSSGAAPIARDRFDVTGVGSTGRPTVLIDEPHGQLPVPEARSSTSVGPLLEFGPHRASGDLPFLEAKCLVGEPGQTDHIRISGFRIHGPSFGHQDVGDKGILINKCVDVEISNMEIAGFGGEGIRVQDGDNEYFNPPILAEAWQLRGIDGVCREPPYNGPTGRIGSPNQVRIIGNYIHHNQQPSHDGHAGGYGVQVTLGAYARISQNLFSDNRHSIEGGGNMGGYEATQNLVLRYGGVHWDSPITIHTHAFDIHGTGDNGFDGWAGARTVYSYNAFQFDHDNAISIRGSPRCGVDISNNVFPHPGLENDWGADAVSLHYRQDIGAIKLGPNNRLDTQTYGRYGVCDFDADGIDDLFLATGVSWWFSGMGEFPWRFLALRDEQLPRLRFGYFDADNRCDVLMESNNAWMISSGGTGQWYRLGQEYAPLSQVAFGRFDLNQPDYRPGVTRRTTHAFWRTPTGRWTITTLTGPDQGWQEIGGSGFPMSALRFGDFDGDGVTDVLAVASGRWAISSGAAGVWHQINETLGDDVRQLYIADIDNNNKDDLIRLTHRTVRVESSHTTTEMYDWAISYDGATSWRPLKSYEWVSAGVGPMPVYAYARRFGMAPGAGILTIDRTGTGLFYAPLESRVGANPDWTSTFRY